MRPKTSVAPKVVCVVEHSDNGKTGPVSATYTPYQTCPNSCPLKPIIGEDGNFQSAPCYASCDLVGMHMRRLTKATVTAKADLIQIQTQECESIKDLTGRNVLRLKVGGDTPNTEYAEGLADACKVYSAKHGQKAYGYTHNWKEIARESFGGISILASCDSPSDIADAKSRGYATAVVVSSFPNGSKAFDVDGHKVIPCFEQTKGIQCVDCRLCFDDNNLRKHDISIGFEAHGRKADDLKTALEGKGL